MSHLSLYLVLSLLLLPLLLTFVRPRSPFAVRADPHGAPADRGQRGAGRRRSFEPGPRLHAAFLHHVALHRSRCFDARCRLRRTYQAVYLNVLSLSLSLFLFLYFFCLSIFSFLFSSLPFYVLFCVLSLSFALFRFVSVFLWNCNKRERTKGEEDNK